MPLSVLLCIINSMLFSDCIMVRCSPVGEHLHFSKLEIFPIIKKAPTNISMSSYEDTALGIWNWIWV